MTDEFAVHEEFLGMYEMPNITSCALVGVMKDALCRMNIPISKVRGQCYDGASTMRGARNGVAKLIMDEEPRALYTHCYGHSVNLAVNDALKMCKPVESALETTHEITKLIKYSPRREGIFRELKSAHDLNNDLHSPGIRLLCPTRWTVRANALSSVIANYEALLDTWEEAADIIRDTEIKARINGVSAMMKTFDFLFGTVLGETILRHVDNLSRTLQDKKISAAEGQQIARLVISTIADLRKEEVYGLFWDKLLKLAESMDVYDPKLPRQRKRPARYDGGLSAGHHHQTPKEYYRQLYYEVLDSTTHCLTERFDQPGYRKYCQLEQLLIKAGLKQDFGEEFRDVCSFYKDDFNPGVLETQLITFGAEFQQTNMSCCANLTIFDIRDHFRSLTSAHKTLLDQVGKVLQLILVMPATNATSERSFSGLRRVKTYLRSTMKQERLNNLMIIHTHKERTDLMDLKQVANDFVRDNEHRLRIFGSFKQ